MFIATYRVEMAGSQRAEREELIRIQLSFEPIYIF